jgi:hypothetical protein
MRAKLSSTALATVSTNKSILVGKGTATDAVAQTISAAKRR